MKDFLGELQKMEKDIFEVFQSDEVLQLLFA